MRAGISLSRERERSFELTDSRDEAPDRLHQVQRRLSRRTSGSSGGITGSGGISNPSHQGARRTISQSSPARRVYWNRSWSRLSWPCQNSKRSGFRQKPPQAGGVGTG